MKTYSSFILVVLLLLVACEVPSHESKVYFWRAVYNPLDYDGEYQIKTEIDTVLKEYSIDSKVEEYRAQLYVDEKHISHLVDSLRSVNAFADTTSVSLDYPLFTKLPLDVSLTHFRDVSDSLFVLSTQVTTHYYHTEYGLIKVTFPHSGHPGKVFSYELKKIISGQNGKVDTLEVDPIIQTIRKVNLERINRMNEKMGYDAKVEQWY
ncbi:hypothetical protein [Gracilimonas tropica]|uniref:hypothetical protein n=1 Tax=Gracilimonas tropica TaxID=454600 RepID=UPI0012FB9890|nr:hypothetical protein [Gracilimonas tropica]